jgi:chromosome segregation ATPase
MKEEIHKKKVCGNKLYPLKSAVETLQLNLTTLEETCSHEKKELLSLLDSTRLDTKALQESRLELEYKAEKDKKEIQSLKSLLQTSLHNNGDLTAKIKHCQADMKEEIHKKKVCGEKLYPYQRMITELQENITKLESDWGTLKGENNQLVSLKEEIINVKKRLESSEIENASLKRMLHDLKWSYDETVAKWKHCKADMKEEIHKKKVCGEKLYPLLRTIEELKANLTSLNQPCISESLAIPSHSVSEEKDVATSPKKGNIFKRLLKSKRQRQSEL